jgi:hypothetical protein
MAVYLKQLLPQANLLRWFPSQKIAVDGSGFGGWSDASSFGVGLLPPITFPEPYWIKNAFKGWSALDLAGTDGISDDFGIMPAPAVTVRDVFIVARYEATTFGANPALLWPLLVGDNTKAYFQNPTPLAVDYERNGEAFPQTNMQGPMERYALLRLSVPAGQTMAFTFGPWEGKLVEAVAYSQVLSGDAERAARLFFNCKYDFFRRNENMPLEFPDPSITGIEYARFYEVPTDWDSVTISHVYDDESATFNDTTDTPPKRWELGFTGLTREEAQIFDAFYSAARKKNAFTFKDKENVVWDNVRIESYERDHDGHKSWSNTVNFTLVKYYN